MPHAPLLAIDQGTTSTRAILFDAAGNPLKITQRPLTLSYPHKGWVEQDPDAIWSDTASVLKEILDGHGHPAAIGITNQRETTVLWDRRTGKPLAPAIVWQDRRTADLCDRLRHAGHEKTVQEKTGLVLDPYFSATKLAWLLDNVDGARAAANAGHLAFGTIDCWLLWKLTEGRVHATDVTNASRTSLFNIHTLAWDDDLLALFNIPRAVLPDTHPCVHNYGQTALFGAPLPITGIAGDQQAALIGQACFEPGMLKATYGTGCFILMNTGADARPSTNRLLTTIAYQINGQTAYAIEGSIFVAGSAVQWLRDQLGVIRSSAESEQLARSVPDTNGVMVVPALTGLGAPYWDAQAQGAILNLTRESTAAHIVRATLESNAYQTEDLLDAMRRDSGRDITALRCDGGLILNHFVAQTIADQTGIPVEIPTTHETTARGAAFLAGLGAGIYSSLADIAGLWKAASRFEPAGTPALRAQRQADWHRAVARVRSTQG